MTSPFEVIELQNCKVQVPRRSVHRVSNGTDHTEVTLWDGTVIETDDRLNIMEKLWGDGESPR